ncbi:MAG: protein jag, partial [Pseudonocardiaceae bacterium]
MTSPSLPTDPTETESTDPDGAPATASTADAEGGSQPSPLEREGEIAADYLEELLDIADLDGDIDMDVENDRAAVSVVGGDLSHLVGREGVVLEALQELTRLAVHTATGQRSRLMLDVGGYR